MRVGILTDYPSPSTQAGPAVHTKLLAQRLESRGHDVVLMGPDTDSLERIDASHTHLYWGGRYPTHKRVVIAMPGPIPTLVKPPELDVIHSQTNTHMIHYGLWLREMYGIPVLNTHTIHLPTHSHFLVADALYNQRYVRDFLQWWAKDMELAHARMYNSGDRLIVQSRHFVDYWRERGVTVPIDVIGRPIAPHHFSVQPGPDPFPRKFAVGNRLLCVCRHDREKRLDHLVDIFVSRIAPNDPAATLTMVGNGHDHGNLQAKVDSLPYSDRIHLPGEVKHTELVDWYAHADLFVYTSLSETFGNVVNEALWSGLPVVALDDKMGVGHQVADEVNGYLIQPGRQSTNDRFAMRCLSLLGDRQQRRQLGEEAANLSRRTSHPDVVLRRFEKIYEEARRDIRKRQPRVLKDQSRRKQLKRFAYHMGQWGFWNGLLLGIGHTATRLGAGRPDLGEAPVEKRLVVPAVLQRMQQMAQRRPAA